MRSPWAAALLGTMPGAALACALPPSVILTLPTGMYIWGAAVVVALTAALGTVPGLLPQLAAQEVRRGRGLPVAPVSYLSFLVFLGLLTLGWLGPTDPMHNLLTLVFWTGVWVALPLASMLGGNLWRWLTPWTAPVRIARVLLGRTGGIGLARLGHWPAVAGMLGFSWFQIVSMAPEDPRVLAGAALVYWLVIFGLAVAEGEDWLERGEFLTVFFGMVARVSPVWTEAAGEGRRLMVGVPGAQILRMPALDLSQMAFVTLALAALTFDGLRETFWWLALVGENPLEFTGRSAVMGVNTAGLIGAWALTAATVWAVLRLGRWLGGVEFAAGPVVLSFLAIAAGYHAAHYLVMLLTAGQYALVALNDPLMRGDSLMGMEPFFVSFGFLSDPGIMTAIYVVQVGAILLAHMLAVVLALNLGARARAAGHLPMTVLMVAYTVLGLWLLSTARGA